MNMIQLTCYCGWPCLKNGRDPFRF